LRLAKLISALREKPPGSVEDLLLREARGAMAYFAAWQGLDLRWKGTSRKPIPPEWRRMALRQSLLGGGNRNATHPVSAMMNYAYAVLESRVRVAVAEHGLDPEIGYLHTSRDGRQTLVYDLMEPLRPHADLIVLGLIRTRSFASGDFYITSRGICRLHPQLARAVAGRSVPEWMVSQVVKAVKVKLGRSEDDPENASSAEV
jgi:CRISPR-associated protein Cas1